MDFKVEAERFMKEEAECQLAVLAWRDMKGRVNFFVKATGDIELLGIVNYIREVVTTGIISKAFQPSQIVTAKQQPKTNPFHNN